MFLRNFILRFVHHFALRIASHRVHIEWILEFWIVFNIHFHSYAYFRWILNLKSKSFYTFNKCTHACLIRCTTNIPKNTQITKNCDVKNWFWFPSKCVHRSCTMYNVHMSPIFNSKINKSKIRKYVQYLIIDICSIQPDEMCCQCCSVIRFWLKVHGRSAVMTHKLTNCM